MNFNSGAFTKQEATEKIIYIHGNPQKCRADCKAGRFLFDNEEALNGQGVAGIEMQVLRITPLPSAQLFKTERHTDWLNLIFVTDRNQVASVLIKGESMDNFISLFRNSLSGDTPRHITELQLTATMAARSSQHGAYYAVEFSVAGELNKKTLDRNRSFFEAEGNGNNLFDSRVLEEFIKKNVLNGEEVDNIAEVVETTMQRLGYDTTQVRFFAEQQQLPEAEQMQG